jgi:glycosyltransferase involved in cell wall biosynthesis
MRDQKIINSLSKKYSLLVLGWNRQGKLENNSSKNMQRIKLFNLSAPSGTERYGALRLIPYLPLFWMWVFVNLSRIRPNSVHACDLSTVAPCYFYKILFRKKLVFDIFDRYAMAYIPRNRNIFFRILYAVLNNFEENFAKGSDVLINVSDELLQTFRKRPKICVTIMNCSVDHLPNRSKQKTKDFRILFTGHIRAGRGLELIPNIVANMQDVQVLISGRVEDRKLLSYIQTIPNTKYLGFIDHEQVLELEVSSDVMMALYDLELQIQNKYVMGNKLFEAMMCGTALITNVAQEIVNETSCGIIVDYDNIQEIKDAILKLRDNPELCNKLGDNGRRAFLEKYNWTIMEQRLYKIYDKLL